MPWRSRPSAGPPDLDWYAAPVPPGAWAPDPLTTPSTEELLDAAVAVAVAQGVPADEVERSRELAAVRGALLMLARTALRHDTCAVRVLTVVGRRADLDDEVLWNTLTHLGPQAATTRAAIISDYLDSGRLCDAVVHDIVDRHRRHHPETTWADR